jgi:hypothetical protein
MIFLLMVGIIVRASASVNNETVGPIHVSGYVFGGFFSTDSTSSNSMTYNDEYGQLAADVGKFFKFRCNLPFQHVTLSNPFFPDLSLETGMLVDSGAELNIIGMVDGTRRLSLLSAGTCNIHYNNDASVQGMLSVVTMKFRKQEHNITVCVTKTDVPIMNLEVLKLWGLSICEDGIISKQCGNDSIT